MEINYPPSIHSSLAIENNQLSLFQVEAVINGKAVIGEQKDNQEVKNAYKAYEEIDNVNPYSVDDLKKIQGILTFAIEDDSGKFRNHGEAVYDEDSQIFMAPPHRMLPVLMDNLFNWMNEVKEKVNPLILSSIFHYEFVFIHPFSDGNGSGVMRSIKRNFVRNYDNIMSKNLGSIVLTEEDYKYYLEKEKNYKIIQ